MYGVAAACMREWFHIVTAMESGCAWWNREMMPVARRCRLPYPTPDCGEAARCVLAVPPTPISRMRPVSSRRPSAGSKATDSIGVRKQRSSSDG
jgi:hypothetical protein